MFYTDLRVRGGHAEIGLSRDSFYERHGVGLVERPDWILLRTGWPVHSRYRHFLQRFRYERIDLDAVDLMFENQPDPAWHPYRTPSEGPKVALYRLIQGAPSR